jgi:hypothetical protein
VKQDSLSVGIILFILYYFCKGVFTQVQNLATLFSSVADPDVSGVYKSLHVWGLAACMCKMYLSIKFPVGRQLSLSSPLPKYPFRMARYVIIVQYTTTLV